MSARAGQAASLEIVSPSEIARTAEKLRATCARLRSRSIDSLIGTLGAAGERFLDPNDDLRREALERLPDTTGLSNAVCEAVLDGMAAGWTVDSLRELVKAELGGLAALDGLVEGGQLDRLGRRASMALGPALCVQIGAGGVPGVGVTALLRSLVVKAPTLLKAGRGDVLLPTLFARALADADAALAESCAVVYWPGESTAHIDASLIHADTVVVYGSDAAVTAVRARTPAAMRVVAYHHRVSVGVVGRGALVAKTVAETAADVAMAVVMYDQRGCVSPQVIYVEEGGACSPHDFAGRLADAMAAAESSYPGGMLDVGEASRLQQARGTAEMMAAERGGNVRHGGTSPWTVTWEPRDFASYASAPVSGRWIRIRPIGDAAELPSALLPLGTHLQTVGVAGLGDRLDELAVALGGVGASRVAPFRAVPFPPPWWHHDGRGPLLDLVRWIDVERPD